LQPRLDYNLFVNKKAARHLSKVDARLRRVIRQVGPGDVSFPRGVNAYRTLVQAVAHQQLTGKAAKTILSRVIALYPGKKFPSPEDLVGTPDGKLRAAGFSRAKVASVKDIAAKTLEGVVPSPRAMAKMTDAEIVERLTSIRGVGPWTVEMLLIFSLGRLDVWPVDDLGIVIAAQGLYGLPARPKRKELLALGEPWRPYRTIASWYLWQSRRIVLGMPW
jgi:DNA-3-methyladenine glycosylase II